MAGENSGNYEIKITTAADASGAQEAATALQSASAAADQAAVALEKVAQKSAGIQPPPASSSSWFAELIMEASASRAELEAIKGKLGQLNETELDSLAAQVRNLRDAAQEAGQSTNEFEQKLAMLTEAQDRYVDAQIAANTAGADAEAIWARANDVGTLASGYVDVSNALKITAATTSETVGGLANLGVTAVDARVKLAGASAATRALSAASTATKTTVDGLASGIKSGTGALKSFERAAHGGANGIRGLIGLIRIVAGGALANPFAWLAAAVAGLGVHVWRTYAAIRALNEEVKKTEAEGVQRLADRVKEVSEEAKKLATDSFKQAREESKAIADQWSRSLEYSRQIQRLADEKDNAQLAYELSQVDVAEAEGLPASDATARRAKIRQDYADAKLRREQAGLQNEIDSNNATLLGSGQKLEEIKARLAADLSKLQELRGGQSQAARDDSFNANANKINGNKNLPENTAAAYDVAISRLSSSISQQTEELAALQNEHDALTVKIQGENTLLETQIRNKQQVADLNKKTETNRTGVELTRQKNQEIQQKDQQNQQDVQEFNKLPIDEQLRQREGGLLAKRFESGTVQGHQGRKLAELLDRLKNNSQDSQVLAEIISVVERYHAVMGRMDAQQSSLIEQVRQLKRQADDLASKSKTTPIQ